MPEWTFSRVEGPVMFLQQAENTSSSGDVLAHEMTHLVMNRFFERRRPLWLNEGLAEYYGEFAYSAFKGVKKSKRAQFGRLANAVPAGRTALRADLSARGPARRGRSTPRRSTSWPSCCSIIRPSSSCRSSTT